MKQKFIEWFTKNNNGCSPAMEGDRSFVRDKTQHMFVETRDVLALLDELEAKEKRTERALSLLNSANTDNVWDVIGRLKVVIGGDYRSESEIAAAAGKGE